MAKLNSLWFSCLVLIFVITQTRYSSAAADQESQLHIVYLGALPQSEYSPSSHHLSIIERVVDPRSFNQSWVRSYSRSFNAFAVYLTDDERQKMASLEEVVSVFPNRILQTQTTRSWDFMGFYENIVSRNTGTKGNDVIVGVMDTGIWPESASFSDEGFGPIPSRWKGACRGGHNFTCNKKVIGARYYNTSSKTQNSARDRFGHGSHTASTAAGNIVEDVSFYGLAKGTARGGLPSARIAVYKVCFINEGCSSANILAAFDDAIADGVDIITISLGPGGLFPVVFDVDVDTTSIGAFHAMERGILTVQSAGNDGPVTGSVASVAPWIFSVAASNIDRRIIDKFGLANGTTLTGNAINPFKLNGLNIPLVDGKAAPFSNCSEPDAEACVIGCLDPDLVKGKIVVCNSSSVSHEFSALGVIGTDSGLENDSPLVSLPASLLSPQDFVLLKAYINSTKTPRANISQSQSILNFEAPVVASYSSRGPNRILPDILKPDISAPGVNILASYSPVSSPSGDTIDKRSVKYSIMSGTSMACPHAAGVAAYLKSLYPNWSPSAIKSAIMTTAWQMNRTLNKEAEFAYGNGHINPVNAANPGLVYETFKEDYIRMLCNMNYNVSRLRKISGDNTTSCPKVANKSSKDLNYPSMTAQLPKHLNYQVRFFRTVTNVGTANSTYIAKITNNPLLNVIVKPRTLSFRSLNERKSFVVIVSGKEFNSTATASLVWSDGTHRVRSPIILYSPTLLDLAN